MARSVAPHQGLKVKEIGERNRTLKAQNALPVGQSTDIFNVQRLLWHWPIVVRECEYCVKGGRGAAEIRFQIRASTASCGSWPAGVDPPLDTDDALRLDSPFCFAQGKLWRLSPQDSLTPYPERNLGWLQN